MALLMGVRCVQGMAFGSPVVPEENRMLVVRLGSPVTDSKVLSLEKRSSQEMSPPRSRGDARLSVGTTITVEAPASTTVSYRGMFLPPRTMWSMVTTQSAPAMAMRLRTSPAGKLSAMDTTRDPARMMAR